jgi:hypothetical protein
MVDIPHVVASPSFSYEEWKIMAKMVESLEQEHNISDPEKLNTTLRLL